MVTLIITVTLLVNICRKLWNCDHWYYIFIEYVSVLVDFWGLDVDNRSECISIQYLISVFESILVIFFEWKSCKFLFFFIWIVNCFWKLFPPQWHKCYYVINSFWTKALNLSNRSFCTQIFAVSRLFML